MRRFRSFFLGPSSYVAAIMFLLGILLIWCLSTLVWNVPSYIVPTPTAVFRSIQEMPYFYVFHFSTTFLEAILGLGLGFSFGLMTALLMHVSSVLRHILGPPVLASQAFPKEALAPFLVVLFGFGLTSKVIIAALIVFFPVVVTYARGLSAMPFEYLDLLKVYGVGQKKNVVSLRIVFAMPYLLAALRFSVVLAVVGATVGEYVGGGGQGLGYVILSSRSDLGTDRMFAALLLLWAMSAALSGVVATMERVVLRRLRLNNVD